MAKYLTDRQLAELFGVSRATVWNWAKSGVLPKPKKIGPNTSRWSDEEVRQHETGRGAP